MRRLIPLLIASTLWSCQNIDDASPSSRKTFIKVLEGPKGMVASGIEPIEDGYVLMANMKITDDSLVTVFMKTDKNGERIGAPSYVSGGTGLSIKRFESSGFTGFIVIGDSVKLDPAAEQGGNTIITSLRVIFLDDALAKTRSFSITDTDPDHLVKTDFRASALTVTADNRVMILGTYAANAQPVKTFLATFKSDLTFEGKEDYRSLDRDHVNARSLYAEDGRVIWASSVFKEQSNFTESYGSVSQVKEPLAFDNYSMVGQDKTYSFFINDIKPGKHSGYGIVGTVARADGSGKNLFFTDVDQFGTIQAKDSIYFDAIIGSTNSVTSDIDDAGETLTSTSDGGFILAGTLFTSPAKGKGEHDIMLIKVRSGQILWTKTIGGVGDEVPVGVLETADEGILVYGTNTIGDYSTLFMIKTDRNGELSE